MPEQQPKTAQREIRVPQQARSRRTRERTLEAASTCFEELGYDETTTAEIAKRAGIAVGSVYDYFTDKRAILLEVLHDTVEVVANIVIQGLAPSERWREEDPTLIVRGLVHQVFHARRVNPGMQRILWERFFKDPEFRAATMAIEERVQGAIVSTLAELKATGKLRIDDVKTAAYVIQLSVEWVSSRLILGEEGVETDNAAEMAADMICRFLFKDYE